jgi:hypothetical protein
VDQVLLIYPLVIIIISFFLFINNNNNLTTSLPHIYNNQSPKMHFTKTLAGLLIGVASLAGFANAAAIPTSDISDAKRDAGSQLLARWTAPAGFSGVQMSNSAGEISAGNGLFTEGLVTCIGVVVTGTSLDAIRNTRFMAHLTGSWFMMETQWTAFQDLIEQADIQNKRAWVSIPTTSGMDSSMQSQTDEAISNVLDRINSLAGNPTQANHPYEMPQTLPAGTMWVTNQNEVFMGGAYYP